MKIQTKMKAGVRSGMAIIDPTFNPGRSIVDGSFHGTDLPMPTGI